MNLDETIKLAQSRTDCGPNNVTTMVCLVQELKDIPGDIVEAGSYKCGMSIAMAHAAYPKKVYACDVFGEKRPYEGVSTFDCFLEVDFDEIKTVTAPYTNLILVRGAHEDTIPVLAPNLNQLSLIFMDSDYYSSHKVCLSLLWHKLSSGGVIIFHDIAFKEVQQAILEEIPKNECDIWLGRLPDSPNMGIIRKK